MTTKIIQVILSLSFLLLLFSCRSDSSRKNALHKNNNKEIPSSITEKESYGSDLLGSSLRWKDSKDIVERLFEEAMEKDKELKRLNNQIREQFSAEVDSLASYEFYAEINNNYWSTANRFASSIRDSTLKNKMQVLLKGMESDYQKKVSSFEEKKKQIAERSIALNNQLYVLKILTTVKMITQYQENGIPKIEQLENLIRDYDLLIKENQVFIDRMD